VGRKRDSRWETFASHLMNEQYDALVPYLGPRRATGHINRSLAHIQALELQGVPEGG
jgi:hypothetical protein